MSTSLPMPQWLADKFPFLLLVIFAVFGTYFITYTLFVFSVLTSRGSNKQPPTLPYFIPYIGYGMLIARDANKLYETAAKASPHGVIGARLAHLYVYIISGASNVQHVFRNSKSQSLDQTILELYDKAFLLPKRDLEIFRADTSGHGTIPLTNVPEHRRIWKQAHNAQQDNLRDAVHINHLAVRFSQEFQIALDEQVGDGWKPILLHEFFQNRMSRATLISTMGDNILKVNPNTVEDFWIYFPFFISLFMGAPRWWVPEAWDARKRLCDSYTQHLKNIEASYDEIKERDLPWDPDLGARFNRLKELANRNNDISIEGRGILLMTVMIGINGNAVPMASWILIELVRDPALLQTVRELIITTIKSGESDHLELDAPKLLAIPLISSIWTETLRLRMSTTVTRQLTADLELNGYLLKAGNFIMVPNHLAHIKDPEWTEKAPPEHPPTSFWAERFLVPGKDGGEQTAYQPKTGVYFPFGGGISMCPGRFFAKQEILLAVAIMIIKYDIELIETVDRYGKTQTGPLEPDFKGAGAGGLFPDGDLRCRIKKRVWR